jgi:dTDP-4-dehydrorhamnose 3,5-epimerase
MHWQVGTNAEVKLVRCTAGAIFAVIVDVRHDSETVNRVFSVELSAANHRALFVPTGFAHGFQSIEDDSEVFYQMSAIHDPGAARGSRWDDPSLNIPWPQNPSVISDRDRHLPLLSEIE